MLQVTSAMMMAMAACDMMKGGLIMSNKNAASRHNQYYWGPAVVSPVTGSEREDMANEGTRLQVE